MSGKSEIGKHAKQNSKPMTENPKTQDVKPKTQDPKPETLLLVGPDFFLQVTSFGCTVFSLDV